VIVGGGFAGIHAAQGLRRLPLDVTVIDRRNHHTFQPLLYQVALAVLSPADIAQPIRMILRHQTNTEILMDEVVGIDTARRQVRLLSGAEIPYDYLVLATGATHSYLGHDDWAAIAPGLKTIEDAIEIRRRVLLAFELAERQMLEHGWHPPLNLPGPFATSHSFTCATTSGTSIRPNPGFCCWRTLRAFWPPILRTSPPKPKRPCANWEWKSIPTRRLPAWGRDGWKPAASESTLP
jgi:NAD(P)H-nitrite reductase large subunit